MAKALTPEAVVRQAPVRAALIREAPEPLATPLAALVSVPRPWVEPMLEAAPCVWSRQARVRWQPVVADPSRRSACVRRVPRAVLAHRKLR